MCEAYCGGYAKGAAMKRVEFKNFQTPKKEGLKGVYPMKKSSIVIMY
jgi:hypothetical protein